MATLEFLQEEWINDGNFVRLGDERDPIIGQQQDGANFTIPREPVRRRVHIKRLMCSAEANTCSCRACPHCDGSESSDEQ
jgi:hypothetical protein